MKYKVIKLCTRKSEYMKVYNVNDLIELPIEEAVLLLKDGIIEVIDTPIESVKKAKK